MRIRETYKLNQSETNMSETDVSVVAGEGLQNAFEYQVPVGEKYIFNGADVLSMYLYDDTPAEASNASLVDVVVMDSAKQNMRTVLNQVRYTQIKEFQDLEKLCHLDIRDGEEVIADEGEFIIIRANCYDQALDASASYFNLTCQRERRSIF